MSTTPPHLSCTVQYRGVRSLHEVTELTTMVGTYASGTLDFHLLITLEQKHSYLQSNICTLAHSSRRSLWILWYDLRNSLSPHAAHWTALHACMFNPTAVINFCFNTAGPKRDFKRSTRPTEGNRIHTGTLRQAISFVPDACTSILKRLLNTLFDSTKRKRETEGWLIEYRSTDTLN